MLCRQSIDLVSEYQIYQDWVLYWTTVSVFYDQNRIFICVSIVKYKHCSYESL